MSPSLRVLRVTHSGVLTAWRERERILRLRGLDVELVSARRWEEGGRMVEFEATGDTFVHTVRTFGRHPNLFLFDPRPLWTLLGLPWDVLDIHEEPCSIATAEVLLIRLLRRGRTPFVLYSAQNIEKRFPVPFRWIERLALHRASGVSVCNTAAGQIVAKKGLRTPASYIPLGVDITAFRPAEREAPSGGLALGYVGRLSEQKGVQTILDALCDEPSWRLTVIGSGPYEENLVTRARSLGIADRVDFTGPAAHGELPDRYRCMDVVVVPSLPTPAWEEQFCRVAVEAMASGVPVVASRSGALPDVVGDAGLLFEPGDSYDLRRALGQLADPEQWAIRSARGAVRATSFTWDVVADAYQHLYEDARA